MHNSAAATSDERERAMSGSNGAVSSKRDSVQTAANGTPSESEVGVLDRVADALARLGRVSRVSLTVEDKMEFVRLRSVKRH